MAQSMVSTWAVKYKDGMEYYQYRQSLLGMIEQPAREIEWERVEKIVFDSQLATAVFDFHGVPEDCEVHLVGRSWNYCNDTVSCWMLVTARKGATRLGLTDDSVLSVVYAFPDGNHHTCHSFNCTEVSDYGAKFLHCLPDLRLAQNHDIASASGDLILIK